MKHSSRFVGLVSTKRELTPSQREALRSLIIALGPDKLIFLHQDVHFWAVASEWKLSIEVYNEKDSTASVMVPLQCDILIMFPDESKRLTPHYQTALAHARSFKRRIYFLYPQGRVTEEVPGRNATRTSS